MTQTLVQATCPKCARKLKIDATFLEGMLRCKFCGQAFRQKRIASSTAPLTAAGRVIAGPAAPPATATQAPPLDSRDDSVGSDLMSRYRQRRKRRLKINLSIAAAVVVALGIVGLIYRHEIGDRLNPLANQIAKAIEEGPSSTATVTEKKDTEGAAVATEGNTQQKPPPLVDAKKPPERVASKTNDSLLDDSVPAKPAKATRPKTGGNRSETRPLRITGYPGRGLLIGVKNYLYANPVNPGYRSDNAITQDPLGFKGLRQALVRDFGFHNDQIGELSDVAAKNPNPPIKATIEKTITEFLNGSRPQDRVVLVFMGHAIEVTEEHFFYDETKAYLVPIEADPKDTANLIPLSWLYGQLAKCPARQKLLVLDVSNFDPEQGMARSGGEAMKPGLFKEIEKVPQGVQTWVSCSPGEYSYQFASNGYHGSVFMHLLLGFCDLSIETNRTLLQASPAMKEGSLPLALLAPEVNKDVTKRVKERANLVQTPRLFGTEGPAPEKLVEGPAPTVTIALAAGGEKMAEPLLIAGIIKELELDSDRTGSVNPDALPPFWAKHMDAYAADYKNANEFKEMLATQPFRKAVVDAARVMQKHDLAFRKDFKYPGDEGKFKKELERIQEQPATIEGELDDAQSNLDMVGKEREKEMSKRWQAHYDFVYARLLAKKTYVREYNFALGNKLKKDAPVVKDPKNNNGWVIIPTEKMQQKDTRDWDAKRQKLLDKIVKDHAGTPWEVLARREKSSFLGLTIQEAKVE